jgi:uncharacterized protein (DUF4213/DUF364 family)
MNLFADLLESIHGEDCEVRRVVIGLHWTLVQSRHIGMAHTFRSPSSSEVLDAGRLAGQSAAGLAKRLLSWDPLEACVGLAALNSLIEPEGSDGHFNRDLIEMFMDRVVVIVGRFPFNDEVRRVARVAHCLEMDPQPDELPAAAGEQVIPGSDIVVISATALINKTMPRLLELSRQARCVVLGPSTPMNQVLLDYGADVLAGVRVTDGDALARCLGEGVKKFKHLRGIQPVTWTREDCGHREPRLRA